jgi:hypothetical protein
VTLCCPGRNTASGLASGCPRCGGPFCSPSPPSPRGLSRAPCHRGVCGGRAEGGCAGRVHQRRGPSARAAGRLLAGRGREARVQARLRSPSRRAGLPWGTPLRRPASAGACERVHRRGEGRGGSEGVSLLSRARDAIIPLSPGGDSRGTPRAVLPYPRFLPPLGFAARGGQARVQMPGIQHASSDRSRPFSPLRGGRRPATPNSPARAGRCRRSVSPPSRGWDREAVRRRSFEDTAGWGV